MSDTEDNSNPNKYLTPVTSEDDQIIWDNNPATLAGNLYETRMFWQREGLFQDFLLTGAVPMRNGRLAVDSDNAVYFLNGNIDDSMLRGDDKPCPDTPARIAQFNAARRALDPKAAIFTPPDPKDPGYVVLDKDSPYVTSFAPVCACAGLYE